MNGALAVASGVIVIIVFVTVAACICVLLVWATLRVVRPRRPRPRRPGKGAEYRVVPASRAGGKGRTL